MGQSTEPVPRVHIWEHLRHTEIVRYTEIWVQGRTQKQNWHTEINRLTEPAEHRELEGFDLKSTQNGNGNLSLHSQPNDTNHIPKRRSRDNLWFEQETQRSVEWITRKYKPKAHRYYAQAQYTCKWQTMQITTQSTKNHMQYTKLKISRWFTIWDKNHLNPLHVTQETIEQSIQDHCAHTP